MLLPQFSIRTLFGLTALAAVVAWVLSQAVYGALWAQCAAWTFVFAVCLLGVHGIVFLMAWSLGQAVGIVAPGNARVSTPFSATGTSPFGPLSQPQTTSAAESNGAT